MGFMMIALQKDLIAINCFTDVFFLDTSFAQCDCSTDCVSNCTAGQYYDSSACVTCSTGH